MTRWGWIAVLCAVSLQAQALRTGEIRTESRLNEPLRATLPITNLTPLEARSLDVRVAESEIYQRLGLVRSAAVSDLVFELSGQGAQQQLLIKGSRPLLEPYIVLLLDLRTTDGRLLREYTVLLDPSSTPLVEEPAPAQSAPPVVAQQSTPPAPVASQPAPARTQEQAPAPALPAVATSRPAPARPAVKAEPFSSGDREREVAVPAPLVGTDAVEAAQSAPVLSQAPSSTGSDASSYGPVAAGETLYAIATAVQPAGVSVDQTAWALFENNPQAFDGSVNTLRRGAMLSVPDSDFMQAVSAAEAKRLVRGSAADSAPTTGPRVRSTAPAATPKPVTKPTAVAKPVSSQDPFSESALGAGSDPFAAEPASRPAQEPSSAEADAFADAPDAFADAPDAFADAPDAFDEAPDAFASAEDAFDEAGAEDAFAEEATDQGSAAPVVVTTPEQAEGGLPSWLLPAAGGGLRLIAALGLLAMLSRRRKADDGPMVAEPRQSDGVSAPRRARDNFASTSAMTAAGAGALADEDDEETVSLDAAPLTSAPESDAVTREFETGQFEESADVDQTTAFDEGATQAMEAPTEVFAAAEAPTEVMPTVKEPADVDATVNMDPEQVAAEPAAEEDDVFALDQAADGMDETVGSETISIDISGSDPVSEADFNLAYGLYDEAELTLKTALADTPERVELHEKLAEVYFASGNTEGFEETAKQIKNLAPDSAAWSNVALLGSQLLPDSPLFSGDAAGGAVMDLDFDAEEPAPAVEESSEDFGNTMAFSASDLPSAEPEEAAAAAQGNVIEFDASDFATDEPQAAEEASPEPETAEDDSRTVAFSLDDEAAVEAEEPAEAPAMELSAEEQTAAEDAAESDDLQAMDMDLDNLSLDGEGGEDLNLDVGSLDAGEASDDLTISDLDLGALETDSEDALDLSDGTIDLGDDTMAELEAMPEDAGQDTLHMDAVEEPVAEQAAEAEQSFDLEVEDALDLSDGTIDLGDDTMAELEATGGEPSIDTLHLDSGEDANATIDLGSFDDGSLSDGDDLGGKLDLAKGYIEMSEIDMARSLLDEVIARGSPEQQAEAQAMLDNLG